MRGGYLQPGRNQLGEWQLGEKERDRRGRYRKNDDFGEIVQKFFLRKMVPAENTLHSPALLSFSFCPGFHGVPRIAQELTLCGSASPATRNYHEDRG